MARVAGGLEPRVDEFVDQRLERHAVLQAYGNRKREAVHEAGKRRAFLGHLNENFAGLSGLVHADGDVAFVSADGKFVRDGRALAWHLSAERAHEKFALFSDA